MCITFVQRRTNVFDVGPTLHECYTNVLCLLGNNNIKVAQLQSQQSAQIFGRKMLIRYTLTDLVSITMRMQ